MTLEDLKKRSDLSADEIKQLMDDESDVKIYKKLNFLKLKAEGYTTKQAYELADLKRAQAYLILTQWENGGYEAIVRKPGSGRNPKLDSDELKEVKRNIDSKILTSPEEVQKFIENEFHENYTIPGFINLVKSKFDRDLNEDAKSIAQLSNDIEKELRNTDTSQNSQFNELKQLIESEDNAEVLKKLFYLQLRSLDFSNRFASSLLGITTATGNNWLSKWNSEGYSGLLRKKGQGRKKKKL